MCCVKEGSLGAARTRHLAQTVFRVSVAGKDRLCSRLEAVTSVLFTYLDPFRALGGSTSYLTANNAGCAGRSMADETIRSVVPAIAGQGPIMEYDAALCCLRLKGKGVRFM